MSKSNEADLQRKEAIDNLKGERIKLLEKLNDLSEKINIVNDQITTLSALTSDIT